VFVESESEEVVFDCTNTIETPAVGGDALGELGFHGSLRREIQDQSFGAFFVGRTIFVGHGCDLAGEAVTECVHAGALAARVRDRTVGQESVIAIRFDLFFGSHFVSPLITTRGWERRVRMTGNGGRDWRLGLAGIGEVGILDLFSRVVNERRYTATQHIQGRYSAA
jgi:hypothetical protein